MHRVPIGDVKQYIVDSKSRMAFDDVISREARLLINTVNEADFSIQEDVTAVKLKNRVDFYLNAANYLIRVAYLTGRWGDGTDVPGIKNLLLYIYNELKEERGGFTVWIELSIFPVLVILSSYGIGLTSAERWADIRDILRLPIRRREQNPVVLADGLNPSRSRLSNDIWQSIEGFQNSRTALSDLVCESVERLIIDDIGIVSDFEETYDLWDLLNALVYCESNSGDKWAPIGRVQWRVQSRFYLIYRLRHELSYILLHEGYFNGFNPAMQDAIKKISNYSDKSMW